MLLIDTKQPIVYSFPRCGSFSPMSIRVVAQGLAHLVRDQGVGGSSPLCPKS